MFKNYLTVAVRNLLRHKGYAAINILGLAVGMAFCILMFLYVRNESTYDTFHKNPDQIYRIYEILKSPTGETYLAASPDPLARVLKNDYPDLEVVRLSRREMWVTLNGKSHKEDVFCANPEIFQVFNFPLLKGGSETALNEANSAVITEDLAMNYFGSEDPMGKILTVDLKHNFVITGVLKKLPENSSIQFHLLVPDGFRTRVDPDFEKRWWSAGSYTYVRCPEAFPTQRLKAQLPYVVDKYLPEFLKNRVQLDIQPMTGIHLDPRMTGEMVPGNSKVRLYILSFTALSVLLIACFNFMNLSTARYTERAKEVGMRKVIGAQRFQLIGQFIGEAIFLSLFSLVLGLALVELFLPEFNALVGKDLDLGYGNNILALSGLLGFGLFVGVISGGYPAFFLSAYQPVEVLKGLQKTDRGNVSFRKVLVIAQFAISILLVVCELVVIQQVRYMKSRDLGFNLRQVVAIPVQADDMREPLPKIDAYLTAIRPGKGVLSAGVSEDIPGLHFRNRFGVIPKDRVANPPLEMIVSSMDDQCLDTYEMQLVEGRNFSPAYGTDKRQAVLINETAAKRIGWSSAVGREIKFVHGEGPFTIVGVVRDIHFKSLQHEIEPLVYRFASDPYKIGYVSVRIRSEDIPGALSFLEDQWRRIVPDRPFEYLFLDDAFNKNYQMEEKTTKIVGVFCFLAIFLACLGLFGLTALAITQRTKEIGIRKVLGASVSSILVLLSKEFVVLVALANLIAWPVAYYGMNRWLQDFAYRIELGPGVFVLGGVLALAIALLTVSAQAVRAARANPVDALRYE